MSSFGELLKLQLLRGDHAATHRPAAIEEPRFVGRLMRQSLATLALGERFAALPALASLANINLLGRLETGQDGFGYVAAVGQNTCCCRRCVGLRRASRRLLLAWLVVDARLCIAYDGALDCGAAVEFGWRRNIELRPGRRLVGVILAAGLSSRGGLMMTTFCRRGRPIWRVASRFALRLRAIRSRHRRDRRRFTILVLSSPDLGRFGIRRRHLMTDRLTRCSASLGRLTALSH